MNIPIFPDSREIVLQDKHMFDEYVRKIKPEISSYNFTNVFAWRVAYNWNISELDDSLIVFNKQENEIICLEPIGASDSASVIQKCFNANGSSKIEFVRTNKHVAHIAEEKYGYNIVSDRDNFDYVYRSSDLIELPGRKYDAKRNFINRIKSDIKYEYIEINESNAMECHDFAEKWCEDKLCETNEGLMHEFCAIYEMLSNFKVLGLTGGAIAVENKVVAFSLGEALSEKMFVIHVEKADTSISGMYQLINNEFAIHEASNYKYINREQDLGIPGLRKAKESYQPVKLVETYRITEK